MNQPTAQIGALAISLCTASFVRWNHRLGKAFLPGRNAVASNSIQSKKEYIKKCNMNLLLRRLVHFQSFLVHTFLYDQTPGWPMSPFQDAQQCHQLRLFCAEAQGVIWWNFWWLPLNKYCIVEHCMVESQDNTHRLCDGHLFHILSVKIACIDSFIFATS